MAGATIKTKFSAVDKMTSVIKGMSKSVSRFGNKAASAFHRVEIAQRRVEKAAGGLLGTLGKIGLTFGAVSFATSVLQANAKTEDSFASLQAITGVTGEKFDEYRSVITKVSDEESILYANSAKLFELIGSAKPELLSNAEALGDVAQNAIILGKAARMEAEPAAKALTTALNQFGLGSDQAARAINVLAAGAKEGASGIAPSIQALEKFGTVAANLGISLEESIGAIETLAPFEQGAEAGTKLRNVLSKLSQAQILPKDASKYLRRYGVNTRIVTDQSLSLETRLREMSKIAGDANAIIKVFGSENSAAATAMLQNVDVLKDMTKNVTGTSEATKQAAINQGTLIAKSEELKAKFVNLFTSTESNSKSMNLLHKAIDFTTRNLTTIIKVVGYSVGVLVALKAIIVAVTTTMAFMKGAIIALTMAQTAFNFVMSANPIGLIIIGIGLLIGLIVAIIAKYEKWGAAMTLLLGPLGVVINLIMAFREHWDYVKDSFTDGGIIAGIKAIGKVIISALLKPIQQLVDIMPDWMSGERTAAFKARLDGYQDNLIPPKGADISGPPTGSVMTTAVQKEVNRVESTQNQNVGITFGNMPTGTSIESTGDDIANISLTPNIGMIQ